MISEFDPGHGSASSFRATARDPFLPRSPRGHGYARPKAGTVAAAEGHAALSSGQLLQDAERLASMRAPRGGRACRRHRVPGAEVRRPFHVADTETIRHYTGTP